MYNKQVEIRWSDLDPNFHLRHSVYYDWGAFVRISFLNEHGITPVAMMQHHIGPIIFREECGFKKEIHLEDKITVNLQLMKSKKDGSRWTMQHEVWKNGNILCAVITIDGAGLIHRKESWRFHLIFLLKVLIKFPKPVILFG